MDKNVKSVSNHVPFPYLLHEFSGNISGCTVRNYIVLNIDLHVHHKNYVNFVNHITIFYSIKFNTTGTNGLKRLGLRNHS